MYIVLGRCSLGCPGVGRFSSEVGTFGSGVHRVSSEVGVFGSEVGPLNLM